MPSVIEGSFDTVTYLNGLSVFYRRQQREYRFSIVNRIEWYLREWAPSTLSLMSLLFKLGVFFL